jgi:hypothetical protein
MNAQSGKTVATGTQIANNLYQLDNFLVQQLAIKSGLTTDADTSSHSFQTKEPLTTWESWHKRFEHLGKSSIQTLLDKNLVVGLDIDL